VDTHPKVRDCFSITRTVDRAAICGWTKNVVTRSILLDALINKSTISRLSQRPPRQQRFAYDFWQTTWMHSRLVHGFLYRSSWVGAEILYATSPPEQFGCWRFGRR
jgi:hypothetical protein